MQAIDPKDIDVVPAPDVSGDLASYLTTTPGVVTTGDRGGQLFVFTDEDSQFGESEGVHVIRAPRHVGRRAPVRGRGARGRPALLVEWAAIVRDHAGSRRTRARDHGVPQTPLSREVHAADVL